ncbi:zinc-dependent alcohol dehydrogenase [Pontivivens insulae]|uniref:2-dehydro-3-deoxy-L-rhamnonate dehydrogenase (NAD(+)) n=1 Tax=Pontivivens insulae TaxID=1639689 RepID=A0A2R8A8D7_9RHOB|nr:alcohol dehydrogenase catalytic domain-containing protein [Pontivivens insulae]RED18392.1 L-iditol 2-dehydrogenase [Pontivivens insulae]SPF28290.1 2-dehydro-3-deoxy-L-rhamnonate dehydrogenase (NAD(+)) [Pontivivens insulae]
MKALVYTGPHTLEYRDFPDPTPADGEVVVHIEAVGICGSDMHAYAGHDERRPAPLILGHEAAGTVAGTNRRVTINPLVTCGSCPACTSGRDNLCPTRQIISMPPREGGFAEQVAMPEGNLVHVPDGVPIQKAALAEPLACGWHAVRHVERLLDIPLSEAKTLVMGGGAIGLGAALALRAHGCEQVTVAETNPARAEVVRGEGFEVINPIEDTLPTIDAVIDGVGFAATRASASAAVRPGGVIAHIGLGSSEGGLDIRRATLQEITFIGTYTYTAQEFRDTAAAIFDGRLGALDWTEERPLAEGAQAFSDIAGGQVAAPKIILIP